jgi:hypothetical protein
MESQRTTALKGRRLSRPSIGMLKTKTYGIGRICAIEGCGTRLSAYNPSTVCALHSGAWEDEYQHGARRAARRDDRRGGEE